MSDCYVLKVYNGSNISYSNLKLDIPNVNVEIILIPYDKVKNIRIKNRLKKIHKSQKIIIAEGVLHKYNKVEENPILKFNIKSVLEKIITIYGFNPKTLQIGLKFNEFNSEIIDIVDEISEVSRFINSDSEMKTGERDKIFNTTGIYISKSNKKNDITVKIENNITIYVKNKEYYDVELVYDNIDENLSVYVFDSILRNFGTKEDYLKLFKGGFVKKMVLIAK